MDGYASLVTACALFVGSHFVMSHPARAKLVSLLGARGFQGFYSLVSLAFFGWMIWALMYAPAGPLLWAPTDGVWIAASLLSLLATILFAGSFVGNPVLADPDSGAAKDLASKTPAGMFRVTRHPMMWGFALWGISHILVAPRTENFIFLGSFVFLALAGAAAQDKKKAMQLGDAWQSWQSQTSYWPRLSRLSGVGFRIWLGAILFWLAASWAHGPLGGYAAGIYRWL
jgi:uncharacterized membrane protein